MIKFLSPERVKGEKKQLLPILDQMLRLSPPELDLLKKTAEQEGKLLFSWNCFWYHHFFREKDVLFERTERMINRLLVETKNEKVCLLFNRKALRIFYLREFEMRNGKSSSSEIRRFIWKLLDFRVGVGKIGKSGCWKLGVESQMGRIVEM